LQTFLPYPSFEKSAKCLDYRRLGKQRVEAWQIYNILKQIDCIEGYGGHDYAVWNSNIKDWTCINCGRKNHLAWENHPIVKMWKGYELALLHYGLIICDEWIERGYKDNIKNKFLISIYREVDSGKIYDLPHWLGDKEFHDSHKSNLLRKNKEYYSQFSWNVPDNLPYKWVI